jgi:hypothetical protein
VTGRSHRRDGPRPRPDRLGADSDGPGRLRTPAERIEEQSRSCKPIRHACRRGLSPWQPGPYRRLSGRRCSRPWSQRPTCCIRASTSMDGRLWEGRLTWPAGNSSSAGHRKRPKTRGPGLSAIHFLQPFLASTAPGFRRGTHCAHYVCLALFCRVIGAGIHALKPLPIQPAPRLSLRCRAFGRSPRTCPSRPTG